MTLGATDKMNVVWTLGLGIGGVHLRHIEPAVGEPRMTAVAGLPSIERVRRMASKAAQAFVHPFWSAVVGGAKLLLDLRSVALITDPVSIVR